MGEWLGGVLAPNHEQKKQRKGVFPEYKAMKKSEVLSLRIDTELVEYIRKKASDDCRSIAQQIAYMIKKEKETK